MKGIMNNEKEKENILLIISNIIHTMFLLSLVSFLVFVALNATPEQSYKHHGVGAIVIPLLILNYICGWIIWKINGKPRESYRTWKYDCYSGFGVRVAEVVFVCAIIFMFMKQIYF